jgi:hypothetical protein
VGLEVGARFIAGFNEVINGLIEAISDSRRRNTAVDCIQLGGTLGKSATTTVFTEERKRTCLVATKFVVGRSVGTEQEG